jgi:glycosyltransferase involved in cell wall biosynthesis
VSQSTVSVVIPTYYRNDLLVTVIESVRRQSWDDTEIIVVDGSGEAHASTVVESEGLVFLVPDEEISVTEARNRGIERATGTYVQLLDDDDKVTNDKFRVQVAVLEENPDVGVVYSGGTYTTGEEFYPSPEGRGDVLRQALMLELYSCITSTMLLRRDIIDKIHPLPETQGADDTHWKVALAQQTRFDFIDESLVLKHVDPDSRGWGTGNIRALEEFFERYDHLYDQQPPEVYRTARANYYKYRASVCLGQQSWSPSAVLSYVMAFRNQPSLGHLGLVVGSVLGRWGVARVKSYGSRRKAV